MARRNERYRGKTCGKHPALCGERLPSGHCPACNRERVRRRELGNPAAVNAARRARYARNPAVRAAQNEKWRKANLPKCASKCAEYRARSRKATPNLTEEDRRRIHELYAEAARVSAETGIAHHVDHDVPLARSGLHHPDNMHVIPAKINLSKAARYSSTLEYLFS